MAPRVFAVRSLGMLVTCVFLATTVFAVPANQKVWTFTQPDGTEFQGVLTGDEFYAYHQTVDGLKIVQNPSTGVWEYAIMAPDGNLLPSGQAVGKDVPRKPVLEADEVSYLKAVEKMVEARAAQLLGDEGRIVHTPPSGTIQGLILLADFPDAGLNPTYTSGDFTNLMNTTGYNSNGAHGSFKDYFLEVSYGNLTINTTVSGWYTLPNNRAFYGQNTGLPGTDQNPQQMIIDVIVLADPSINFSAFDGNSDGWIDFFGVIHQGQGEEQGGAPADCIWSHQGQLGSAYTTGEGVNIQQYHTEPELLFTSLTTVGVICHESGHFFGLPDLYDTDGSSEGIGHWGLMGSGSWCGPGSNGSKPCHMCGWSKIALGWVTPSDFTGSLSDLTNNIPLPALDQSATVMRVFVDDYADGEYFTVTNRYQRSTVAESTGFDQYLPGSGAMIMHVDDYTVGNTNESHKKVDVEERDGLAHLDSMINRGDAGDVYSSPSHVFNDTSNPNSKDYSNVTTGVAITDFQGAGTANMTVDVQGRSPAVPAGGLAIGYDAFGADRLYTTGWGDGNDYAVVRFTVPASYPVQASLKRIKAYFPLATTYTASVYSGITGNDISGYTLTGFLTSESGSAGPGYAEITLSSPQTFSPSSDFYVQMRYQYSSGNPLPMTDDYTDDDRSYANDDATLYTYVKISTWGWNYDINIRADIEAIPPAVEAWELY